MNYYQYLTPLLFKISPERAHTLAIFALKYGLLPAQQQIDYPVLKMQCCGIDFPNIVGMAPGFDKDGEVVGPLFKQGFGFVEVGTVTPKPQPGNPLPRLFRLEQDKAVINRFGFNSKGSDVMLRNITKKPSGGVVGVNIGKNKDSKNDGDDYVVLLQKFYGLSDYITINISSPNTPGLRDLHDKNALEQLLVSIMNTKAECRKASDKNIPIFLKISPDIQQDEQKHIAELSIKHKVDALIISNTTIGGRKILRSPDAQETGGLSGKPLFKSSTDLLRAMYQQTNGDIPLIGVGGISSAEDAYQKIKAGASLVQLYSALVYQGFELVNQINKGLVELLKKDGYTHISEAIGAEC